MLNEIINFRNANSRDTYFTVHNVKEAHKFSKGKGVKVGIIDWSFAVNYNLGLYADYVDLTGDVRQLYEEAGHGLWMATVLKEIAPECDVYAINGILYSEGMDMEAFDAKRFEYIQKSIDWAIKNKIDVLSYSHAKIPDKYTKEMDAAIDKAVENGITTTFIHCDSPNNIFPYGCFRYKSNFRRNPDINIYHFDYNVLFIEKYLKFQSFIKEGQPIRSGDEIPYFSFSSMSPVLGGFLAILKSIKPNITAAECKEILIKTSYEITEESKQWFEINPCPNVVNIGGAVKCLLNI